MTHSQIETKPERDEQPIIVVQELFKSFGSNKVLRGVNLSIERGESLVILGGSGSGKSVLLRHLVGLHKPDQGQILVSGVDVSGLSRLKWQEYRRRFGMSFQEGALFDSMNVFENIAFPLRRDRKLSKAEMAKRVEKCLEMVGMPSIGKMMPSELSGGMRRRVGFARAIALEPEILLLDEPTTGLDPIMTSVLNEIIISLRKNLNATTITITHDISSARQIATRVAMLFKGELIHQDEKDAFFQSQNPIVQQFIEGRAVGPATEALLK